jgi:hypothetical protein
MQVTLISLNPPIVREINKIDKPDKRFVLNYEWLNHKWLLAESSLKEWELSEKEIEKLRIDHMFYWCDNINALSFNDWAIGQILNVDIVQGKAVIV